MAEGRRQRTEDRRQKVRKDKDENRCYVLSGPQT